jgi:hypothetical protein
LGQVTSISPGALPDTYWDGGLLLLAGLSSALLAWAFHRNDHHRQRDLADLPDREAGLWRAEHQLAYLFAAATALMALFGLLTGYNKMGGHHWQPDGIPWLLASLGTGLLTNMLHSVRHHQLAWEPQYDRSYTPVMTSAPVSRPIVQEPPVPIRSRRRPTGPIVRSPRSRCNRHHPLCNVSSDNRARARN